MAKSAIDYTTMSLEELGDRFEIVDPLTIGCVNNLCRIHKELARRLRKAEAEHECCDHEKAGMDAQVRHLQQRAEAAKAAMHSARALIDNGDAHKARSVNDETLGEMEDV